METRTKTIDADNVPIEKLELSLRTFNCLKSAGFHTMQDILNVGIGEMVKLRNFGEKTAKEISDAISAYHILNAPTYGQLKVIEEHIHSFKVAVNNRSANTQEAYFTYVNRLLDFSGGYLSREKLHLFLSRKVSKKASPIAYAALKFFCNAIGMPFEVIRNGVVTKGLARKREGLACEEVKQLIAESKKHFGTVEVGYIGHTTTYSTNPMHLFSFGDVEIGYLVLSTIYGFKRIEIFNIREDSIDIDNRVFCIKPVKPTDQSRYHVIPKELLPFLSSLKEGLKRVKGNPTILHYNHLFDKMCWDAGIQLRPRLGWESVRRTLDCELALAGVNSSIIKCFMGLKLRETELLSKYDWKRVDEAVFEKHPFLRSWI